MFVYFDHTSFRSRVKSCESYLRWFFRSSFYDVIKLHSVVFLISRFFCFICLDVFLSLCKFISRLIVDTSWVLSYVNCRVRKRDIYDSQIVAFVWARLLSFFDRFVRRIVVFALIFFFHQVLDLDFLIFIKFTIKNVTLLGCSQGRDFPTGIPTRRE